MTALWWPSLAGLLVSTVVLWVMLRYRRRLPLDHPNERSLHRSATPRVGGLGIFAGVTVALALAPVSVPLSLLLPVAGLALVSVFDDYFGLSARLRLIVHLAAAAGYLALTPLPAWPQLCLVCLALVWMTNLYNFMDGADGLAGGMTLFGFGTYCALAWLAGDGELALISLSVVAAVAGFLIFNFPPARLFLGDAGSVPLGFLAGTLGVLGWQRGLWPWLLPLLVFSPFIVDASVTLFRRALRGEQLWRAHRSHYYQRLVRMGWSHRRLALAEYAVMAASAVSGLALVSHPDWLLVLLLLWASFYIALAVVIERRWKESGLAY